jgi:putative ABC transport system permease protein
MMATGTLALGVGPAVAVFGMANQLLLQPLPGAPNTESAGYLVFGVPGRGIGLSAPDFDELRRSATLVDGMAVYGLSSLVVTSDQGRPLSVYANTIYGDYFEILGTSAVEGRLLAAEDTDLGANPLVAVISETLRDRVFGAGTPAVGRTLTMNGQQIEVVGVSAAGFAGAERGTSTEAWLPVGAWVPLFGYSPDRLRSRDTDVGRDIIVGLREGSDPAAIEAQVGQIIARIATTTPEAAQSLPEAAPRIFAGLHTPPLVRDQTHRTVRMMTWAVALVLAIACANVANLLLFRNLTRRGALATLRALGASTGTILRMQLAESLFLGFLGASAGLVVAWLIALPFRGEQLVRMPRFEGFTLDGSTALFACGAALLTVILFGVVPAALAGRFDLSASLRASRTRDSGRMGALRALLATGQVSLTLALLVGGLLMVRTIANLRAVDTGLDIEGVAWTPILTRPGLSPEDNHTHLREMLAALVALPEVRGAALDVYGPHASRFMDYIGVPGAPEPAPGGPTRVTTEFFVTPGWFELFGISLLEGRAFRDEEWRYPDGDEVVLTASLARRLFGRVDVVGRTVIVGNGNRAMERRVIGVVGDYTAMTSPDEPTDAFFVPFGGAPSFQLSVMTRVTLGDAGALARVREVLESFHPDLPIAEPVFLTERVESLRSEERILGYLLWMLSAFGVLMSAVGLYGVIYFIVASRQKELGIRRALGADSARVVRVVGRSAALIIIGGVVFGTLAAYPLSQLLESQLFGVENLDAASYVGAFTVVLLAAFAAGIAPARAAMRIDPVDVLRDE